MEGEKEGERERERERKEREKEREFHLFEVQLPHDPVCPSFGREGWEVNFHAPSGALVFFSSKFFMFRT